MYKLLFVALVFLFAPLFADEDIIVHLANEERLSPLYLHAFQDVQAGFSDTYLQSLEKVLRFDLDHNGKTTLITQTKECKELGKWENDLRVFDKKKWQQLGCEYVIKVNVANKQLTASMFSVKTGGLKGVDGIVLSGKLEDDRRVIHSVADSIHNALFGTKGVCDTRILYTVRTRNGTNSTNWVTEVWESDYDGANARQITRHANICVTPTYVPSQNGGRSRNLLYVCYQIGQPKIFTTHADKSGTPSRLTTLRGDQLMPALSLKLDKIAFINDITGNPDLFIQDFSPTQGLVGKPRQIFSAPQAAQGTPSFSPDGKKVAFVSNKDGTPRVYVIPIPQEGASLKDVKPLLISKRNRDNTCPAWSPDGNKIAYCALSQGARQIWIYDFATGKEIQLTDGSGHKENPTWAPDSLHIMFNSSTDRTSELYLLNLNQKKTVKITNGPGEKRFPAWEPITRKI